uniref:Pirin N-terminal domain-containing protein n=1 Tax=Lotharella globosa TaxID=91324 RepID=A0A7S3YM82_9EUKA
MRHLGRASPRARWAARAVRAAGGSPRWLVTGGAPCKTVASGTKIGFLSDVEGNIRYWNRFISRSRVLRRDPVSKELELVDGTELVYGGDTVDRGPGDMRVQRELINLKEKYPDRVHFILGNRDINKLRYICELHPDFLRQNEIPGVYWRRDLPDSPRDMAGRLKWMLQNTMGCPNTYEFRRQEIAETTGKDFMEVTDEEIVKSFTDSIEREGTLWRYLSYGHLAFRMNDILFVHGGVCDLSLGYVPDKNKEIHGDVAEGLGSRTVSQWVHDLEAFKQAEMKEMDSNRDSIVAWSQEGGYGSEAYGGRLMQYGMGRLPRPNRQTDGFKTRSVVYNDFLEGGNPVFPSKAVTEALSSNGIHRIASGHKPHGDSPVFIRCPHTDLLITTADTSYANNTIYKGDENTKSNPPTARGTPSSFWPTPPLPVDPRGDLCAVEVIFTVQEDGRTSVCAHGNLSSGERVLARAGGSGDIEGTGADYWIGRETSTGWWVKGRVLPPLEDTDSSSSWVDEALSSSSSSSSSYIIIIIIIIIPSHATLLAHLTAKSHSLTPDRPDFKVRRLIPVIAKRAVGPFVFVDHFGPVDVGASNSMDVGPHPHIGISTLTYLLSGAIVHRDSTGADATILPGEVNWMTAGKGVVHSERGNEALGQIKPDADGKKMLHGMQCWVGLPKEQEDIHPSFHHIDHHQTLDVSENLRELGEVSGRLIVGRIPGSPEVEGIPHHWPMFMLDIELAKTSSVAIPIDENHELGVYVVQGRVASGSEEATLDVGDASIYTHEGKAKGAQSVRVKTLGEHARVVVFGGLPFPEIKLEPFGSMPCFLSVSSLCLVSGNFFFGFFVVHPSSLVMVSGRFLMGMK